MNKIKIYFRSGTSVEITYAGDISIDDHELRLYDVNNSRVVARFYRENIAGYAHL